MALITALFRLLILSLILPILDMAKLDVFNVLGGARAFVEGAKRLAHGRYSAAVAMGESIRIAASGPDADKLLPKTRQLVGLTVAGCSLHRSSNQSRAYSF